MRYELISKQTEPTMIEQVLLNRGIKRENIQHFLNLSDADIITPSRVANIEAGVKMLLKHINENSLVYMPIDSDCDGFTSAALFINYLNRLFPHFAQNNIIYKAQLDKHHGIVEDRIPKGTKLVIAIDSSSNEFDIHKNLANAGIDVLVIDHHEAPKVSEKACVINNQLCDYPTKSLSGVGMAYKFCCYIDELLGINEADNFLDLVSLGMIADMMDSRDFETQTLIQKGLLNIRNPFFKEMIDRNARQFEGGVTPIAVAFYVAPFINAINRSGSYDEKILIFESMLDFRAYEMIPSTKRGCKGQFETRAEQAGRTSTNVKNRQKRIQDEGLETIDKIIEEYNLLENKILIIPIPNGLVDKNLSGLIANQLAAKYQRPTLILQEMIRDGVKSWEGSGRSYNFPNLKDFLADTNLTMYAEGHQGAFGVGVLDKDFSNFVSTINLLLSEVSFERLYRVDFILDASELTGNLIYELANWRELWGQNIDEPLVAIRGVKLDKSSLRFIGAGGKTMRIDLPQDRISFIKFFMKEDEIEELTPPDNGMLVLDIIGTFQKNSFNGFTSPQIQIEDYEIVKRVDYYF